MLRKAAILLVVAGLGTGAALGASACGEDREGDVEFEGGTGTTGTTGTTGAGTTGTATSPSETETETEAETETTP
ncbi:MAG TPA: hypothetical protein VFB44_09365 [Thermoleophilaceae bacterium]|nr:hypothetical protein [Thermoleophilaceae bacterium]